MAYNLIPQVFCIFLMKSQSVIFFVLIPLFQTDHQVYRLCILNTFHTEKGLYINDTDPSKLNKMPGNIRCRAYQGYIANLTQFYYIITYKTMTSLDQFQCSLTLADPAFACDQNTLTIYIHQHSVNRNAGSKLYTKPADDLSHKAGGTSLCYKSRHIILICQVDHILRRSCHGTKYNTGNLAGNKALILELSLFIIQLHQIGILYISDNLHPLICKMLQVSCKLKSRTVNLSCFNINICKINIWRQICQIQFLSHFCQLHTFHGLSPRF